MVTEYSPPIEREAKNEKNIIPSEFTWQKRAQKPNDHSRPVTTRGTEIVISAP